MKSGLEGRNNDAEDGQGGGGDAVVSMKSGLEGRNNNTNAQHNQRQFPGLNEVRPRRPEQFAVNQLSVLAGAVSMKSGLEGRNNL